MLRISSVWRIHQIKFQNSFKDAKHFIPVFEILLGSEQLQNEKRKSQKFIRQLLKGKRKATSGGGAKKKRY